MSCPFTEKGLCRDDAFTGKLSEEFMRKVCTEQSRYSNKTIRRKVKSGEIKIIGVCQQILETLPQELKDQRAAANSSPARCGRRRATKRLEPTTAKKSSGKKQKPNDRDVQRKALATLGVNLSEIHFNKRGGKSRGAVSKMSTTAGAAITAVLRIISLNDPNAACNLGILASLKNAPSIPSLLDDLPTHAEARLDSVPTGQGRIQQEEASVAALVDESSEWLKISECLCGLGTDRVSCLKDMSLHKNDITIGSSSYEWV
jgi:hypothetical protein